MKYGYFNFHVACRKGNNQKLECIVKHDYSLEVRSEKITIRDQSEKLFEKFFRPNDRYEHFKQIVQTESSEKISLNITCKPIQIEETTVLYDLINGQRKFSYHYSDCKVKNAEIIGDNWDILE